MIKLTQEQNDVKDKLIEFLHDPNQQYIVVNGIAGSGKTTLIQEVEKEYKQLEKIIKLTDPNYKSLPWVYTATTNAAAKVLQSVIQKPAITIHRLLCLIPTANGGLRITGPYQFAAAPRNGIIIIDEFSYISYELLSYIRLLEENKNKIIFLGDDTQLPPVGLNHTPVMHAGFPILTLTKSVRQENTPYIAAYCTSLVNAIKTNGDITSIKPNEQIQHVDRKTFFNLAKAEMEDKDWSPQKSVILAYKNQTIKYYNNKLLKELRGNTEFIVGDKVILNKTYKNIPTDTILTVASKIVKNGIIRYGLKTNKHYINTTVPPLPDEKQETIDLRPLYARTIHKAQGSTYDKVFLDLSALKGLRHTKDIARLLYVAISRAKYQVIITGDLV